MGVEITGTLQISRNNAGQRAAHTNEFQKQQRHTGGILANSLAVLSDAAHMASDLAGFIVSIIAILLARRSATARLTFGFQRAEVIGAVASVLLIWGLTGYLLAEAVNRYDTKGQS